MQRTNKCCTPTKADETKLRLNENVKEAFEAANKHEISISEIVSNLKNNATKVEKYEALELALKVMQKLMVKLIKKN